MTFLRHYAEMLIAMFAGMMVLGGLASALFGADDWAAEPMLLGMAVSMSLPMVAWMRFRGHGWAPAWEMTAAMFIPSVGAILLLRAGAFDSDGAMIVQHVAMFPAMLIAMLLRRDEYTHGHAIAR
jgi:hypothetical protein